MANFKQLHERWSLDPDYREHYDSLRPEFELARALIEARARAGLTQAQLAARMLAKCLGVHRERHASADPR